MGSYYQTMHQFFLLIGLGLSLAAPADEAPYGPPAPVYKAKPAPYKEPEYKPQPYEYKYGVVDDVQYQGEPSYPPPPPGGYGPYKGPGAYPGPKPGGYANDPAPPAPVYAPR